MERYWFLTWTTYGTWLPGDARGFVGPVRVADRQREQANLKQEPPHAPNPALRRHSQRLLKHDPVWLTAVDADILLTQLQETSQYRGWELLAVAIMSNHIHLVVGVADDPEPTTLLRDFKAYGSRALNLRSSQKLMRWWTEHGSVRKLHSEDAIAQVVQYVARQHLPLALWQNDGWLKGRLPAIDH